MITLKEIVYFLNTLGIGNDDDLKFKFEILDKEISMADYFYFNPELIDSAKEGKYYQIILPDTDVKQLIDNFTKKDLALYRFLRYKMNHTIFNCNCSNDVYKKISLDIFISFFVILHEIGHWEHFKSLDYNKNKMQELRKVAYNYTVNHPEHNQNRIDKNSEHSEMESAIQQYAELYFNRKHFDLEKKSR